MVLEIGVDIGLHLGKTRRMDENWQPAFGFEARYLVSDQGRCVRIIERNGRTEWRPMTSRTGYGGYIHFHLYSNAVQKHPLAHRVVWQSFNGPIPKGIEINHKNGIKADNRLVNLELATRSENMLHGFRELNFSRNRIKGSHHPKARLWEADVLKILEMRAAGIRRNVVAEKFNITPTAVALIEKGRNWAHFTGLPKSERAAFSSPSSVGSGNARAKLTEADIPKIFAMHRDGISQQKIAAKFGISQQSIGRILLGRRWKHLSIV